MRVYLAITIALLPVIVFGSNNTVMNWDRVISKSKACEMGFSDTSDSSGYIQLSLDNEHLDIKPVLKYNTIYGFRRVWNNLYYILTSGNTWTTNYTIPSQVQLLIYSCVDDKKEIKSISLKNPPKVNSESLYNGIQWYFPMNKILWKRWDYIMLEAGFWEVTLIDYSVVNIKTWEVINLSEYQELISKDFPSLDTPLYNIKKIRPGRNSIIIETDDYWIFKLNILNKILTKIK